MNQSTNRWSSPSRTLRSRQPSNEPDHFATRTRLLYAILVIVFLAIIFRLYYWQVIRGEELSAAAEAQYHRTIKNVGQRGEIISADDYVLATNRETFRLVAQPHLLSTKSTEIIENIIPILLNSSDEFQNIEQIDKEIIESNLTKSFHSLLDKPNARWVVLRHNLSEKTKSAIENLAFDGITFESYQRRHYPEASMAAHLLGFVGKDADGEDIGYFGLEGALEKELKARTNISSVMTDARGRQLHLTGLEPNLALDGRTVKTTIRRDIQFLIETELAESLERYGAKAGEIVIMDPKTGHLLAYAALPKYDPTKFISYDPQLYKNPGLTKTYEPGSTFKIITLSAGLDSGVISPDSECPQCDQPWKYNNHIIKTWNDIYHPNTNMTDALKNSDNTAMIWVAQQIGSDKFAEYLKNFGISSPLKIDLQEDTRTPFPTRIGPVELATMSFGQGISTTSLQMIRAVGAIANNGVMMRTQILDQVFDPSSSSSIEILPVEEGRVISSKAAREITEMMITTVQNSEARWTQNDRYLVAGKTGTSQIPIPGGYDQNRTIASFIAFAPASNPQFVMMVKFEEPSTSPWGDTSAAPTWFRIADKLYLMLNLSPDR